VSDEQIPGLILDPPLDLAPDPVPSGEAQGSLKEIGGLWGLLRFLPGAIRQAFSGREPVGGLPVLEPGQTRPAELAEVDFNPGAPTGDHAPAAQTPAAEAQAVEPPGGEFTVENSLAEVATVEAGVVHEVIAEPLVAEVAEEAFAEASIGEVGAELGEAGLEAGL
jgi:hypothetical protein